MKAEVKTQMIKDITWSKEYHERKAQEETDKLEVLGVTSMNLQSFIEKIKEIEKKQIEYDVPDIEFKRSILFEIQKYESTKKSN